MLARGTLKDLNKCENKIKSWFSKAVVLGASAVVNPYHKTEGGCQTRNRRSLLTKMWLHYFTNVNPPRQEIVCFTNTNENLLTPWEFQKVDK